MNDNYIEYAVPTNSDHWTHESDEVPAAFFERIEKEVGEFVAKHWPGVEFSVRLVPETMSFGNRTRSSFIDEDEENMIATIDHWMSDRWPDWLAEVYE